MAKPNETKIPITDFLEAYRRQPSLYNSLLDTYKNRTAREEAYEAMIKTLKIPQLTVHDIKLKIKSVRTVYTKELRILTREKELNRSYEPKLFWFKRADSFLRSVSLSHCKRAKCGTTTALKKVEEQKMVIVTPAELNEDALQEEECIESESAEHLDDNYATDLDDHVAKSNVVTASMAASTHVIQATDDARSCISSGSTPRAANKTELIIDDIVDQQQQQQQQQQQTPQHQQTSHRKLKTMPYTQRDLLFQQQQHQQQIDMTSNASHCFSVSNGTVASSDDDFTIFGQSVASQLRSVPDSYARSVAKLRIQQVLFEAETGQSSEAVSPHLHNF